MPRVQSVSRRGPATLKGGRARREEDGGGGLPALAAGGACSVQPAACSVQRAAARPVRLGYWQLTATAAASFGGTWMLAEQLPVMQGTGWV